MLERVNDSEYKIELLDELMCVSDPFNVRDLSRYLNETSLRANSSNEGWNDPRLSTLSQEQVALVLKMLGCN